MATTKLNSVIVAVARKLQDERTDASASSDTGTVYHSVLLTEYANRAVRDLLREKFLALGKEGFAGLLPEYIVESAALTLDAGSVAKPVGAWFVLDLYKSDKTIKFEPLEPDEVGSVLTSEAGLDNATASRPKFYEEGSNIKTLGLTSGNVIARYIKAHQDLTVITGASGDGKSSSDTAAYTATTKTWDADIYNTFAVAADAGKPMMFRTASVVYFGTIVSVTNVAPDEGDPLGHCYIVLEGDGLPSGNVASIVESMIADMGPLDSDLKLNENWLGEIIDRMVAMGEADAERLTRQ